MMSQSRPNLPMPVQAAPDGFDRQWQAVLTDPCARAWAGQVPAAADQAGLRDRLARRVRAAQRAETSLVTVRARRTPGQAVAAGVTLQTLYAAPQPQALRPGEPLWVGLVDLAPGATLQDFAADHGPMRNGVGLHREWLVLAGQACCDREPLAQRDYRLVPAGQRPACWTSDSGALLCLRESVPAPGDPDRPRTVHDADAGWPAFAPGIRRRVLWQRGSQAAMLYHALPGAQVPQHGHGHDEECLMLQGELFLDDLLLQAGDYQLAPAGSGHRLTETDTGGVIYAHGDLDLQFLA